MSGAVFVADATPEAIASRAASLGTADGEVLVVFVAEGGGIDLDGIVSALAAREQSFLGGVFPALIWAGRQRESGAILFTLPVRARPVLVPGLSRAQWDAALQKVGGDGGLSSTVFVLVDGLTRNIDAFLLDVYGVLGHTARYVGGGCGSLSLRQQPCLFTEAGVFDDAAVLALLDTEADVGVAHGWLPIGEPVLCTRARETHIEELNWQPAYPVYASMIEAHMGRPLNGTPFFEFSKAYPFGIYREQAEPVVRDPIVRERDDIVCVGNIPENALLQLLHGDRCSLIEAAARAASCSTDRARLTLVFDCISRSIFLGADFTEELSTIYEEAGASHESLVGALSLGEIASPGGTVLSFLNKTIVVGAFQG